MVALQWLQLNTQTLPRLRFSITGAPAFVLLVLTCCYLSKTGRTKRAPFAKLGQSVTDNIFSAIRGGNDEGSYLRWGMIHCRKAHSFPGFEAAVCTPASLCPLASRFLCVLKPKGILFAHVGFAHPGTRFSGMPDSKRRARNFGNVKSWLQLIKPPLFTSGQHLRKQNKLQNLINKGIGAVLIPGSLHSDAVVSIVAKVSEVLIAALAQINGAPNVKALIGGASDAIDTRRRGGITRIHSLNHHFRLVTLFLLVARMVRCPISSSGVITPSLGNTSIIPFFQSACKAEGRGVIHYAQ